MNELRPLDKAPILRDVKVGMRSKRIAARVELNQKMGPLYPFSLADKLNVITESSPWYSPAGAEASPWRRAIIPVEMLKESYANYAAEAETLYGAGPNQ